MEQEQKEPECILVDESFIEEIWNKCCEFLSKFDESEISSYNLDEAKKQCLEGNWQLWILLLGDEIVGSFLSNICDDPAMKVLNLFNLSGVGTRNWAKKFDDKLVKFCQEQRCSIYQGVTRKGFTRYIPEFKEVGSFYIRDLREIKND